VGVAVPAARTVDHPLAWNDLLVQLKKNVYSLLSG